MTPSRFLFGSLLLSLAAGASAGSELVILQAGPAERGLVLIAEGERLRVEESGEAARDLRLPPGTWINNFAALERGWIVAGNRAAAGEREILLIALQEGVKEELPAPAESAAPLRVGALPLIERGQLAGLAWLEGDHPERFTVRAAAWTGNGWLDAETVSRPGTGSQVALNGAVLADGSWLLLWSAFDGEDDEIVWSRRSGAGWSAPRRLHAANSVPDITPVVIPAGAGALAAWSRLTDGHYRLHLARLGRRGWRESPFEGPAGSIFPGFTPMPGGARLLYRNAVDAGWSLVELSAAGGILRRAAVEQARPERPAILSDGGEAIFRWPALEPAAPGIEAAAAWEPPK